MTTPDITKKLIRHLSEDSWMSGPKLPYTPKGLAEETNKIFERWSDDDCLWQLSNRHERIAKLHKEQAIRLGVHQLRLAMIEVLERFIAEDRTDDVEPYLFLRAADVLPEALSGGQDVRDGERELMRNLIGWMMTLTRVAADGT